jgi:LmbE family N-acetylglucosaminyl deacetylase
VARVFGMKGVFDLNYGNHVMDAISQPELKCRLIFLFRLLKVDTVITYDPWGHYEENPDHYVTSAGVESAAWMAAGDKDYPEHFAAGLKPQAVREKYYFGRFQQRVNRVVDTSRWIEKKIDVNLANKAQGPAGETGARLKASLAKQGLRLPLLDGDELAASRNYIREFVLRRDREIGQAFGLQYAEQYHYIGPESDPVPDYVKRNAVRL